MTEYREVQLVSGDAPPALHALCRSYQEFLGGLQKELARHEGEHEARLFLPKLDGVLGFSRVSNTFVFELFSLEANLRATQLLISQEAGELAQRVRLMLKGLELELGAILAPLDALYMHKLALLLKCYFHGDYYPTGTLAELYFEQLLVPTPAGYSALLQEARELVTSAGRSEVWREDGQRMSLLEESLTALEVQYLLSGHGRGKSHG